MLELLVIIEEGLFKLKDQMIIEKIDPEERELLEEYKVMSREITSRLEPSIRQKIQRGGITVIKNTYTGYDSEYKNIDLKYNKLLSVQLAVNAKILLKLPLTKSYELTSLETLTGKMYPINIHKKTKEKINIEKILSEINKSIDIIRILKFKGYDESILKLIKGLKNLKTPYLEKPDGNSIIFSFDRTRIKT